MQSSHEAKNARDRLDAPLLLATHLYGLSAAVRAIIATHPDPKNLRQVFDQFLFQMQAHPAFLSNKDTALALKDFAETLFQPSVVLDIDPESCP